MHSRWFAITIFVAGCGTAAVQKTGTTSSGTHASSSSGATSASSTGTLGSASSTSGTTGTSAASTTTGAASTTTGAASTTTGTSAASTTTGAGATSGTTGADCCASCYASGQSCSASACTCGASACQTGAVGALPADAIDLSTATVLDSPDVSGWPITTALGELRTDASGFNPHFDKRTGAGRWPDFSDGVGTTEFTLWIFENIGGQWYGAAGIRFVASDLENGGAPSALGGNWFYDSARWGALANRTPAVGEQVGFMVSAGDARNSGGTSVQERSNIILVPFPPDTGADFACALGGGSTGTTGTTSSGGTTGSSGPDCCSGACDVATTFCNPQSCQCEAQGSFDLHQAAVYDSPPGIADWAVTTRIQHLGIDGSQGFAVAFDKEGSSCDYPGGHSGCDGSNTAPADSSRWPDVCIPGWNGGNLQYTLWSVEFIDGAWATSGPIEYWCGLASSGGAPSGFAADWYYDGRWGPLANHQPAVGEWVGFFVSAGNARNITSDDSSQSAVFERSNVVFVPFPADSPGISVDF